ncbi:MAG: methyl-accepting chemotaxis protein [Gammaproteobacteria bacterium]|nr:methyl-accepting chemotaxis protein [Gammaproteobacteria bacterium]
MFRRLKNVSADPPVEPGRRLRPAVSMDGTSATRAVANGSGVAERERIGFKLAYKLALVFLVVAAALTWVALEYRQLNAEQSRARVRALAAEEFDENAKQAYVAFLDARRIEKELPLYRIAISIDEHEVVMRDLIGRLGTLTASAPNQRVRERIESLVVEIERYQALMRTFGERWMDIAVAADGGLLVALRNARVDLAARLMEADQLSTADAEGVGRGETKGSAVIGAVWGALDDVLQQLLIDLRDVHLHETELQQAMRERSRALRAALSVAGISEVRLRSVRQSLDRVETVFTRLLEAASLARSVEWQMLEQVQTIAPAFDNLRSLVAADRRTETGRLEHAIAQSTHLFIGVLVSAGILIALALIALGLGVLRPIAAINATVQRVARGDYAARTGLRSSDELGRLGRGFDRLLDERVASLARAQEDNTRLNESVIALLESVAKISRKDLSVRVPVREDITGPIADSLNLLNRETSKVLAEVTGIARNLAGTSSRIQQRADAVSQLASREKQSVEQTARRLSDAAAALVAIAKLAQDCNSAAEQAVRTTEAAQLSVAQTSNGIDGLRETINETSKRIKRLGERSQEIGEVVNVIRDIADRTHGLALNASMQAAAAGESGRGLAVVAEEVQRLAESARASTTQVAALVHNIQAETADAVLTMNEVVSQVVNGTQLADRAGQDMHNSRRSTDVLTRLVQSIARLSRAQAEGARALVGGARAIREGAIQTSERLSEQADESQALVSQSRALLEAVGEFKLAEPRRLAGPALGSVPNASPDRQRAVSA